jgi:PIN domain nuclease of toxin-antitoxin system
MKILLDTQILLWAATGKLPPSARRYVEDYGNTLLFSSASIWEIVTKRGMNASYFYIDPTALYNGLLDAGYHELHVTGRHALLESTLPAVHKDPFDRMLLAQAVAESIQFMTADERLLKYPCSIILIEDKDD